MHASIGHAKAGRSRRSHAALAVLAPLWLGAASPARADDAAVCDFATHVDFSRRNIAVFGPPERRSSPRHAYGAMVQHLHTFLFADLVGFTALTNTHGDDAGAQMAIRFGQAVSRLAADHDCELVKQIGDAVMVRGADAQTVVDLALRLVEELREEGLPPLHIGIHTGPAVSHEGDWYGRAVNLAARVADAARAGEVLITEATVAAAERISNAELRELGPQLFKNVLSPVHVWAVSREAGREARKPRAQQVGVSWVPRLVAVGAEQ